MAFGIKINGKQHSVVVDEDTLLPWVLRDVVDQLKFLRICSVGRRGQLPVDRILAHIA